MSQSQTTQGLQTHRRRRRRGRRKRRCRNEFVRAHESQITEKSRKKNNRSETKNVRGRKWEEGKREEEEEEEDKKHIELILLAHRRQRVFFRAKETEKKTRAAE